MVLFGEHLLGTRVTDGSGSGVVAVAVGGNGSGITIADSVGSRVELSALWH